MPLTASELKSVPTLRKESEEVKGGGKRRVVNGPHLDEEGLTASRLLDVVKGPQQC